MATIKEALEGIKNAVYGEDMRQHIYDLGTNLNSAMNNAANNIWYATSSTGSDIATKEVNMPSSFDFGSGVCIIFVEFRNSNIAENPKLELFVDGYSYGKYPIKFDGETLKDVHWKAGAIIPFVFAGTENVIHLIESLPVDKEIKSGSQALITSGAVAAAIQTYKTIPINKIEPNNASVVTSDALYKEFQKKANSADLSSVAFSGNYSDLNETPQNVSVFKNDANYATTQQLTGKQNKLTFDSEPTKNSNNPVTSSGIYEALHSINAEFVENVSYTASTNALGGKVSRRLSNGTQLLLLTPNEECTPKGIILTVPTASGTGTTPAVVPIFKHGTTLITESIPPRSLLRLTYVEIEGGVSGLFLDYHA